MRDLMLDEVRMPDGGKGRVVGVVVEWEDEAGKPRSGEFAPDELKHWQDQPGLPIGKSHEFKP